MKNYLLNIILILLFLFVSACTSTRAGDIDTHISNNDLSPISAPEYVGHYEFGFEVAAFTECGSSETWWIARGSAMQPVAEFINKHRKLINKQNPYTGRVFVHWRGLVSPLGRYGHWGGYSRQIKVIEILEIRMPSPNDCNRQK